MAVQCAGYNGKIFDLKLRTKLVREMCRMLKHMDFDSIAISGYSMSVIGSMVAWRMNKHVIVCRKDGESSHSGLRVEGEKEFRRFIIIDDLIASGNTLNHVLGRVKELNSDAKFLGMMLFNSESYWRPVAELEKLIKEGNKCLLPAA